MRDFELLKKFIGNTLTKDNLKNVDCYINKKLGKRWFNGIKNNFAKKVSLSRHFYLKK